ncbi:MAG: class I SAM-dependent methyltransferase [bacterium]|nr:class I SAM-dependent methyltransferase [bacterium]
MISLDDIISHQASSDMNSDTIKRLNQLNQDFYSTTAPEFDITRQTAWEGWYQLLPLIPELADKNAPFRVLDLGCGNARFASFLSKELPQITIYYLGIDSSQELLHKAHTVTGLSSFRVQQLDIVTTLINKSTIIAPDEELFDLVVAFGVMHHIPSNSLRQAFVQEMVRLCKPQGKAVFTNWLFKDDPTLSQRLIAPAELEIQAKDLEPNDFFIDWKRGTPAIRYCHHVDETELQTVIEQSGARLERTYLADGKTQQLNRYVVLSR